MWLRCGPSTQWRTSWESGLVFTDRTIPDLKGVGRVRFYSKVRWPSTNQPWIPETVFLPFQPALKPSGYVTKTSHLDPGWSSTFSFLHIVIGPQARGVGSQSTDSAIIYFIFCWHSICFPDYRLFLNSDWVQSCYFQSLRKVLKSELPEALSYFAGRNGCAGLVVENLTAAN